MAKRTAKKAKEPRTLLEQGDIRLVQSIYDGFELMHGKHHIGFFLKNQKKEAEAAFAAVVAGNVDTFLLEVDLRTSVSTVREPYDDGWDRGDDQVEYDGVDVYLPWKRPKWVYGTRSVDVRDGCKAGDTIYLVIERYASGSTFGKTYGNCSADLATKNRDEAVAYTLDDRNANKDYFGGHEDWIIEEIVV